MYGDFVNFKTTAYGTASITFMSEDEEWLSDGTRTYILDLVIIPREYLKNEINHFYVRYATYGNEFKVGNTDLLEPQYPDFIEDLTE